MGTCLGIYLGERTVKYAKLLQEEKSKRVNLVTCGTKHVVGDKLEAISEIIQQTGSADSSLCLNLTEYDRVQTEILKQLGRADTQSVINLEVSDYATVRKINEKTLEYRYMFMDSMTSNDNYTTDIAITDKTNITNYQNNSKFEKLTGLYPIEYLIATLLPDTNNHSLIVNVNEKTQLITVQGNKPQKIVEIDVGMKTILDSIAEQEGSYTKAFEVCRGVNLLADDEILSPELERIIEPSVQDLLNRIRNYISETNSKYDRIYLNGLINLFINVDMLFDQFFGIAAEKLRPYFVRAQDVSGNIAEVIESNEAVALAYEGIRNEHPDSNFMTAQNAKFSFKSLLGEKSSGKKDGLNRGSAKKVTAMPVVGKDKIEAALLFTNLTAGAVFAGYVGFSAVYENQMTKMENNLTQKIKALQQETADVKSDTQYIDTNTQKYTEFNSYISETVEKIREGKIGKYTTYNVANFMQKVAKYIPTNVQLESISSNDNKSVTIVAKSASYSELGYFISQLKLKGILENIKTGKVDTGETITVTIGGDLP